MSDQFIGEIRLMAFTYPPRGWLPCNGQLLPIQTNQALFALLGVAYGGDGNTTFALPDLRGRVPVGTTNGVQPGAVGGEEAHTLTTAEIPSHNHLLQAFDGPADTGATPTIANPAAVLAQAYAVPSAGGTTPVNRFSRGAASGTMAASEVGAAGGNQPHENRQPYLTMNFCIAVQGSFPSRN